MQASALLLCRGSYRRARNLRVLNCLFIFSPCHVALCASKARHRFGSEKVSWCLETSLFLRFPSRDGPPSLPLLSLFFFVFNIFSYLLSKSWVAFLGAWCPLPAFRSCFVEFTQRLNFFWWICGEESVLPVLLLRHLGSSPNHLYFFSKVKFT